MIAILAMNSLFGCSGGDNGSTPPSTPSTSVATLKVVSARKVDDTVYASPPSIAVEYTDAAGVKKAGVPVHFELVLDSTVALRLQSNASFVDAVDATTDETGRASTTIRLLAKAGTGRIKASVTGTAIADSVQVIVRPGKLFRIAVSPFDTAVLVNGSAQLAARPLDYWGNVRSELLTWISSSGGVTLDASGRVTGVQYARATIRVSASGVTDSSYMSVVPRGRIAAVWSPIAVGSPSHFEIFDADGANRVQVAIADSPACSVAGLFWRASADSILFEGGDCHDTHLYKATLPGAQSQIKLSTGSVSDSWPSYSPDGQFIYYTARPPASQNGEIWRMRADGTAPQRIGPALTDFFDLDQYPSVSNDGSTVMYSSNRTYRRTDRPTIRFVDVNSGAFRESGLEGEAPRWSPRNDRIAFSTLDRDANLGQYAVANSDGTGVRLLSRSHYTNRPDPPSWSPDGRWIVIVGVDPRAYAPLYGRLEIIDVQTGLVLPLAWTSQMTYPAWHP